MDKTDTRPQGRLQIAIVTLIIGLLLMGIKYIGYILTQSLAVYSDALESIVNIVSATVLIIVVQIASRPADSDHPYGHGKIESLAATFEGGAVLFAGILIIIEAVQSYLRSHIPQSLHLGLIIVLFAGLVNGGLGFFLKHYGRKFHSPALRASGIHLISDFWTSVGVFLGLLAVQFTGISFLDSLIALIVGVHLVWEGGKVLYRSSNELLDARDEELIYKLIPLFEKNLFSGIIRIHHTRILRSGHLHHIDLHLVVPEFWSVEEAHKKSNRFEEKVISEYPTDGEIHFHLDPCLKKYCRFCDLPECPIRVEEFEKKVPLSFQELVSQEEQIPQNSNQRL